jgi:hypothetical protein
MTDTITAPTPCDACVEKTPDDAAWFFCHHRGALAVAKDVLNGRTGGFITFGPIV